ncbi:Ubiquinone biosynthesis protein Coq4 [Enhydrobacter aerosaccus]|uniref:Ubiquinone biosynthesis protein Coq4 n=1 Tax=Enhydrobacter aerosaccus TaxID=225324 RepID=A0A1T4RBG2_9HYPH|nr:hypothetical protein [Enhydrobacter aerosaccus]SKA13285.1 Ubiquinone biosynthesis protein Coq4 [Enhydrobacter aerosaccus]
MRHIDHRQSDAILGAMRQVALAAGGPLTHADTASVMAAARYLLRRPDLTDIGTLPAIEPMDLQSLLDEPELKTEAIKYLTVMTMVDGVLDRKKVGRVLAYSRALDIEESYLTEIVEAASGHVTWSLADMTRQNMESITGKSWGDADPMPWLLPYGDGKADPELAERYEALGRLPEGTFGRALWAFYKNNDYAFPGNPSALNERFGTPHDSTHVISGYDTSARGEILVSTFTAAMHPVNPMAGHILPVIFSWHLDIKINAVAGSTSGGLDPNEFWHAWARGREVKADLFSPDWQVWDWVERDLETLRLDLNVTPPGVPQ